MELDILSIVLALIALLWIGLVVSVVMHSNHPEAPKEEYTAEYFIASIAEMDDLIWDLENLGWPIDFDDAYGCLRKAKEIRKGTPLDDLRGLTPHKFVGIIE